MAGFVYGSALTWAVGKSSSAPGQIPIEDLRVVLATVRGGPYSAPTRAQVIASEPPTTSRNERPNRCRTPIEPHPETRPWPRPPN